MMEGNSAYQKFLPVVLALPLLYVLSLIFSLGIKFFKVGASSAGAFVLADTVGLFNFAVLILFTFAAASWKNGKISTLVFLLPGIAGFTFNLFLLLGLFGISTIQS